MIKSINSITLRHLNGVYVQEQKLNIKKASRNNTLSIAEMATITKKFQGYGYTFEKKLAQTIFKVDRDYAIDLCREMLENIEDFKSDKGYEVFYKDFPKEVMNMEEADIYINQMLHYWFGYIPKHKNLKNKNIGYEKNELAQLVELSHLKLVADSDIEKLFYNLLSSNVTLSSQYLEDVCFLSNGFSEKELEEYSENILMKETLTTLSSYVWEKRKILIGNFDTATDVLRFITKLSNGELNTKYICFAYFSRTELAQIVKKLEKIKNSFPDIKRYKKPWHKFFKLNAKKINLKKYPNVQKIVNMLFSKFEYETPKGYFDKVKKNIPNMSNKDLEKFIGLYLKFSGDYARQVLSLLNISNKKQYHILINGLKKCMKDVNTRVLLQLYDRLLNLQKKKQLEEIKKNKEIEIEIKIEKIKNSQITEEEKTVEEIFEKKNSPEKRSKIRNVFRNLVFKEEQKDESELEKQKNIEEQKNKTEIIETLEKERIRNLQMEIPRVVNSKGTWRKIDETIFLSDELIEDLMEVVKNGIIEKLKEKDSLKKVFVDESYKNIAVTTSEKDSNISLRPMTKGSKIKFNSDAEVLRFFVGWKNFEKDGLKIRTDIDLSAVYFDSEFNFLNSLAYYNQIEEGFAFSGDIVDAPDGALEFIDIYDLEKIKKKGINYILMTVRSYNGFNFKEINSVFAGVLELTKEESQDRKNMFSAAISQGFQILSKNYTTSTILVDLQKSEYIWIDMNLPVSKNYRDQNRLQNNEAAYLEDILKYFVNKEYMTMYDLIEMNVKARGTKVFDKEVADVIFDRIDVDNPIPLAQILSNFY
ncbi:TerD family protein [Leptotrichia sp. oral taxon 218]|uniref:TerD family protein n=1 Tax=Leptotrichia sp. oral taxon 218 TaxID=712361 RepID=UPI001B8B55D7|nr:TerD family protein [Leptotrichia sp. oral taxon 218]QUB95930.1 TerD family protein [Leptotrichia sp. oral taxon 218]